MTLKSKTINDTGGSAAQTPRPLAAKAGELLQERVRGMPVWIRAPKSGEEFYSGFSRAKLYQLAGEGHIRTASIREPGKVRGTRLFHLQSILEFIAKCELQGETETN
jgi:hypothetical protein